MKKLLMAATAVLALTGAAYGGELKDYSRAGWWRIESGAEHCIASSAFSNDTALLFGVSADGGAWMKVNRPEWKIPDGAYDVVFQIDSMLPQTFAFYADDKGESLSMLLEMDEAAYNLLTKGKSLSLKIGSQSYSFSLQYSAAMVNDVITCAGKLAQASNPFSGTRPTAPVSTPSNPFRPV